MASVAETTLSELTSALPHDKYLAKCGEWQMLQRIQELPELILAKVTDLEDRRHARARETARRTDQRFARTLNSPTWESTAVDLGILTRADPKSD